MVTAKDTLIKSFNPIMIEIDRLYLAEPDTVAFTNYTDRIKEAQAEISFPAGAREERERLLRYLKALLKSTPKAGLAATIDLIETTG